MVWNLWNFMIFPSYWECHHPNWLIFFQRGWNHQPVWGISLFCILWPLSQSMNLESWALLNTYHPAFDCYCILLHLPFVNKLQLLSSHPVIDQLQLQLSSVQKSVGWWSYIIHGYTVRLSTYYLLYIRDCHPSCQKSNSKLQRNTKSSS